MNEMLWKETISMNTIEWWGIKGEMDEVIGSYSIPNTIKTNRIPWGITGSNMDRYIAWNSQTLNHFPEITEWRDYCCHCLLFDSISSINKLQMSQWYWMGGIVINMNQIIDWISITGNHSMEYNSNIWLNETVMTLNEFPPQVSLEVTLILFQGSDKTRRTKRISFDCRTKRLLMSFFYGVS